MKRVEVFKWRMASETVPGRRVVSTTWMCEEEALALDPTAEKLMGSSAGFRWITEEDEALWRRVADGSSDPYLDRS